MINRMCKEVGVLLMLQVIKRIDSQIVCQGQCACGLIQSLLRTRVRMSNIKNVKDVLSNLQIGSTYFAMHSLWNALFWKLRNVAIFQAETANILHVRHPFHKFWFESGCESWSQWRAEGGRTGRGAERGNGSGHPKKGDSQRVKLQKLKCCN